MTGRDGLVAKKTTDKNGKPTTVYVNPNKGAAKGTGKGGEGWATGSPARVSRRNRVESAPTPPASTSGLSGLASLSTVSFEDEVMREKARKKVRKVLGKSRKCFDESALVEVYLNQGRIEESDILSAANRRKVLKRAQEKFGERIHSYVIVMDQHYECLQRTVDIKADEDGIHIKSSTELMFRYDHYQWEWTAEFLQGIDWSSGEVQALIEERDWYSIWELAAAEAAEEAWNWQQGESLEPHEFDEVEWVAKETGIPAFVIHEFADFDARYGSDGAKEEEIFKELYGYIAPGQFSYVDDEGLEQMIEDEELQAIRDGSVPSFYGRELYVDSGCWYDAQGFDLNGYDRDGYDRDGYDPAGKNRDGLTREEVATAAEHGIDTDLMRSTVEGRGE